MKPTLKKLHDFYKAETVLCIFGAAALFTMVLVPPSAQYLSYLDFRVLSLLLCLMAVVAGFNETGIFLTLSRKLQKHALHMRSLSFFLILPCFFTSMWITNDVALITFVPFAILVLTTAGKPEYIIRIIVLQTVAANLGSMLTPVGNPQNLYLYSFYNLSITEFVKITFPYTLISLVFLCISVLLIRKEPLNINIPDSQESVRKKGFHLAVYSLLFLVCLICVLRLLDYRITFLIVLTVILILDRKVLKKVDYALLLTFVFFFILVGNMESLSFVRDYLSGLLYHRSFPVTIAASQIISNVPSAVLLSAFTDNYKALILGSDIGGLGTLVASLASLISYKLYCRTPQAEPLKYLGMFTSYNLLFLVGLCVFYIASSIFYCVL